MNQNKNLVLCSYLDSIIDGYKVKAEYSTNDNDIQVIVVQETSGQKVVFYEANPLYNYYNIDVYGDNIKNAKNQLENTLSPVYFNETKEYENLMNSIEYYMESGKLSNESQEILANAKETLETVSSGRGISDLLSNISKFGSGKLTDEEFDIIKTHAQKGHDMLGISNRPLFKVASQIALTHHEKYDGTGYPNSLKGEDIPIFGRITALADVFDAIGSDRCYKKAWEMEKVLEFIKEQRGKHFDPKLVDIFFDNLDDILKIKEEHQDI